MSQDLHDPEATKFMGDLPDTVGMPAATETNAAEPPDQADDNRIIGSYRLLKKLGQGGMGTVWFAEQIHTVRRKVAIKLIKAGMDTEEVISRFSSERQALAMMEHPAIARVYEAGSAPDGRPYFAMEYVEGVPVSTYCDERRLGLRQRIELFLRICEGVQHAHQKAILHRDLKPSNILITEQDGKPAPKIIDFGLAKAMESTLDDLAQQTRVGMVIGTPAYMSPEQTSGGGSDADTRADVYSLGVILYELLSGETPFSAELNFEQLLQKVREENPRAPSTAFRKITTSSGSAADRGASPVLLRRQLTGDLDWITLKALEKDRERRYQSVGALAEDLRRYLRDEPVEARPPSKVYRARKFVQRNRLAVGFVGLLAIVLAISAVSLAVQSVRIARERDRANREARLATRVSDFLAGVFKVSDPTKTLGNTVTARELLDRASGEIGTALAQDPEVRARLMFVMATTYSNLGIASRSKEMLQEAFTTQQRFLGPDNADTLRSEAHLGRALMIEGHYAEAEQNSRDALARERKILGPENADTLFAMNTMSEVLSAEGHYGEAEKLLRETITLQSRVFGAENGRTLRTRRSLGAVLDKDRRYAEAEKEHRATLAVEERVFGRDHPASLWSMNNIGLVLQNEGRYAEAQKWFTDTSAIERRVLGPEHPNTLATMANLAQNLSRLGRYAEAEKAMREQIAIDRRVFGPEHPQTIAAIGDLGVVLGTAGNNAEAEKVFREEVDLRRKKFGATAPDTIRAMDNLAEALSRSKRYNQARAVYAETTKLAGQNGEKSVIADAWFNAASGAAIGGERDEAMKALGNAIDNGWTDAGGTLAKNEDFQLLRSDPRFAAIVERLKQKH